MKARLHGNEENHVKTHFQCPVRLLFSQLLLLILVLVSCAGLHQEQERPPASPPSAGERTQTSAVPVGPAAGSKADKSSACLGCHDYRENHHPTNFVPANAADFPFPLYKGRVRCLTCHTEDHMGSQFMLRGGPYPDRRGICFKCHHEDEYTDIYPHFMLESDGSIRQVHNKPVCLVCHAKMPDPRVDRTKDVVFRADVAFLCWRCHSVMSTAILNRHVLMKPSLSMLRYLEQNEQKLSVTIPLVPRDRITCSTCHNPHQKGVIIYPPSAKGADAPDRLRLPSPTLCTVCHEM
jgi:predicted CXXCH cytochrome family protein